MFRFFDVAKKVFPTIFNSKNKSDLLLGQAANFVSSAINVVTPFVFTSLVTALSNEKQETNFLGITVSSYGVAGIYCATMATGSFVNVLRRKLAHRVIANSALDMQEQCTTHLMSQSYNYHITVSPGEKNELLAICTYSTPDYVAQLIGMTIPTFFETTIAAAMLSWKYGELTGTILYSTFIGSIVYNTLFGNHLAKLQHTFLNDRTTLSRQSMATVNNFETIQMFNNTPYELSRIKLTLNKMIDSCSAVLSFPDTVAMGQRAITGIGFTALIFYITSQIQKGSLAAKDLITVAYYLSQFSFQLNSFSEGMIKMTAASYSLSKVTDFLDISSEVVDTYKDCPLDVKSEEASIEFKNVSFAYPDGRKVFDNLSFVIPAGSHTAIVGPSGAGKSTIPKLLYRFYDIQLGQIKINGKDISNYGIDSIRALVGIVPQEAVMFNTSLRNNVWYGAIAKQGAAPDDKKINLALEQSNLLGYVQSQKHGLDTPVGERGLKMSGGQLQRLSVCRAALRDPPIFVLDEATSALDGENEQKVQEYIQKVTEGRTTLSISHRLGTTKHADKILVLDQGKIVEQGTHEELLAKNGMYARQWKTNSKGFEKKAEGKAAQQVQPNSSNSVQDYGSCQASASISKPPLSVQIRK